MQKVPLQLTLTLVPILLKQLDTLIALSKKISAKASGLASNKKIKCNDPRVKDAKKDLANLAKQIAAINKALKGLTKILKTLKKIGKVARILKLAATIIPTPVPGPVSLIVTKVGDVGINCLSAVDSLSNLVGYIQIELQKISAAAANALNVVGSICNNEYFDTDTNTKKQMSSLANLNLGNKAKLSSVNANIVGTSAGIGVSGTGDTGNGFGSRGDGSGLGGDGSGLGGDGSGLGGDGSGLGGDGSGLGGDGSGLGGDGSGLGGSGLGGSGLGGDGSGLGGSGLGGDGRDNNLNFNNLLNNGFWDAFLNQPFLQSSIGTEGDYYIVSADGTTSLDGINIWNIDDMVVFSNGSWKRIDSRGNDSKNMNTKTIDSRFKYDNRGIYINDKNFKRTYVSEFYNEYNVSESDINNALNILNELYDQQKSEVSRILSDQDNLSLRDNWLNTKIIKSNPGTPEQRALLLYREFPSDVYFGKSVTDEVNLLLKPSLTGNVNDVFTGGKPGDFFIDTENKLIYGPKESNTSWGEPIKY